MKRLVIVGAIALAGVASNAQAASWKFDDAAYVTCREAHAMQPQARIDLAMFLAEHSAKRHGVVIPDDQRGGQLGFLVRGGCTLAPDAYLFTVIDRAIIAEQDKLPKR